MPRAALQQAIEQAGLRQSFELVDLDRLLSSIEAAEIETSLINGSFYRFLESLLQPRAIPATWQKLVDLGWSDDEVSGLVAGNILVESATTLIGAINLGALSVDEFNEFSRYPNQEVEIFYYAPSIKPVLATLQDSLPWPKLSLLAFGQSNEK
jgi:hypothetical protein